MNTQVKHIESNSESDSEYINYQYSELDSELDQEGGLEFITGTLSERKNLISYIVRNLITNLNYYNNQITKHDKYKFAENVIKSYNFNDKNEKSTNLLDYHNKIITLSNDSSYDGIEEIINAGSWRSWPEQLINAVNKPPLPHHNILRELVDLYQSIINFYEYIKINQDKFEFTFKISNKELIIQNEAVRTNVKNMMVGIKSINYVTDQSALLQEDVIITIQLSLKDLIGSRLFDHAKVDNTLETTLSIIENIPEFKNLKESLYSMNKAKRKFVSWNTIVLKDGEYINQPSS